MSEAGRTPPGRRWSLVAAVVATLLLAASTARAAPPVPVAPATGAVPTAGEGRETRAARAPTSTAGAVATAEAPSAPPAEPVTVPALDLNRYAGTWYEVARLPQFFQRNCASDVTARYSRRPDGLIGVDNRCRKKNGQSVRAVGKARVPDFNRPGRLEVAFFLNFYADYWVVELGHAPDYGYAVVTNANRKYLWILSRQPVMDARLYQGILARLRADGFDLRKLKPTLQTGRP